VPQNHEYKSALPRVVDECFASNYGVLMFNAHKFYHKISKIWNQKGNHIELNYQINMNVMIFSIDITYK
jgi:hypothetical protein